MTMSNFYGCSPGQMEVTVPEAVNKDGVTFYRVKVVMANHHWTVDRRYKDFAELHAKLVDAGGIEKDKLPEKKYLGNKDPAFIMKRRRELETYLAEIFQFFLHALPDDLASFLHLTEYDLNYAARRLAAAAHADAAAGREDEPGREFSWTPLEVHAVAERLKAPQPPQDTDREEHDFTHAADRARRMRCLRMEGARGPLGASTVVPDQLRLDFLAFKSLTRLVLHEVVVGPGNVTALGMMRRTLRQLQANHCGIKSIRQLLLCDTLKEKNKEGEEEEDAEMEEVSDEILNNSSLSWPSLERLDLRFNEISEIDRSVKLVKTIDSLLLGGNQVSKVENLTSLSSLEVLELASNRLTDLDDLHVKVGNVQTLNISHNKISGLGGLSRLYSLKDLNASNNRIAVLDHVSPACRSLPCLESLNLQGNRVTAVVDYRLKVFEVFGKRCSEVRLDNELPSQSEVDKVSVLMALRVAREGQAPTALFGNLPRRVVQ